MVPTNIKNVVHNEILVLGEYVYVNTLAIKFDREELAEKFVMELVLKMMM